ncbi:uncharacterized protein PAC_19747 [Phialocephala subalpina]|uniref:Uncharacterized protein n=1 Tax=Phialocephala subalpina TaxID=576137 RepID=A0A1L7XXU8_9HELO|nr:uncharacterized protein PAC_19747 [Phialocephala subalpina]
MAEATTTSPAFWTSFSPDLRTEFRNHLDPNTLGAVIEDPDSESSRSEISTMAQKLLHASKWKEAEELLTYHYLARTAALGGRANADTMYTLFSVGYAQLGQEDFVKSEKTWRQLLALKLDAQDSKLRSFLGVESNLGFALNKLRKYAEAEEVLRELLPKMQKEFHESDPRLLGCMRHLMEALLGLGRVEDARVLNDEGMKLAVSVNEAHREAEIESMEEIRMKIDDA